MLSYLRLPIVLFLWVVALMSGGLSLARELYGIYSGQVPPRSLFWSCVWIAFIVSSAICWVIEHKAKLDSQTALNRALAGPEFSGHFWQFMIFPRTGLAPPEMIHQLMNLTHGRDALDKSEPPKTDCDLFVEIYLQNDAPGKGSILEYVFEIELGGVLVKLQREFTFKGWILEREESQMDAKDYLTIKTKKAYRPITDLSDAASGILEQGKGVEGWLHYCLKDVAYTDFEGQKRDMRLTLNDSKGKPHLINRAWTGEPRPWRIGHDFSG